MIADFRFPNGCTGRITCSLLSPVLLRASARARGDRGEMAVFNPIVPQILNWITVRTAAGRHRERIAGDATYTYQLRAFVAAVRRGEPVPTGPDNAIANMRVIDAVYCAAGLQPRGASS